MQNCCIFRRVVKYLCFVLCFITLVTAEDDYYIRKTYLDKKFVDISSFSLSEVTTSFADVIKNLTLFEFYVDKGKIELTEKIGTSLMNYYPVKQLVNYRLGEYYYQTGDFDQAKEYFGQCVISDSQFHEARKLLAECLLRLNEYKEAYKHYNVLSWFKPDKEVMRNIEYLSNHFGCEYTRDKEIKFAQIEASSITINSPSIDVGISTKDNGKIMRIDCIDFYVSTDFEIYDRNNKKIYLFSGGADKIWEIVYRTRIKCFGIISSEYNKEYRIPGSVLIIKPLSNNATIYVSGYRWFKKKFPHNREYRGMLVVKSYKDQIVVINRIKLDEYLYSVVRKEIGGDKPYDALKTQAVVARTVALYRKKTKTHKLFDVCNGQHCQVYDGVISEVSSTIDAVNTTIGEVITLNDKLVSIFFHANCGGILYPWWNFSLQKDVMELVSDIAEDENYEIKNIYLWYMLPPKLYCGVSTYVHSGMSRWLRVVKRNVLGNHLSKKYKLGEVKSIQVVSRRNNGYVKELKIIGSKRTLTLKQEHKIRNIVPNGPLRSASFFVEYNKNIDSFYFWGAGWGHGVGMCQSGVSNLASEGKNYIDIIKHYYPGTEVKKLY
ncbi:MAG: SpoIID/LytB domain-containing protein [Endomicrobia bacterium]|nr:SpoIID/LytB domain-containing protein [Endomicrobiia bacterium]